MTGWQDSGNIWTRAALRKDGVEIEKTLWFAGRLTKDHPIVDRIGSYGRPGHIEPAPGELPMDELLKAGELDAICTPFMPEGFFRADSPFRHVLPDLRSAEKGYFDEVGFVPGIHLLAFKTEVIAQHPWVAEEVSNLLGKAQDLWLQKRQKYADTTPWLIEELGLVTRNLPQNWNTSGMAANRVMIDSFGRELFEQGIANRQLGADELFPLAL